MDWGYNALLFITALIAATALVLTLFNGYHGSSFDSVSDANGFVATINNRNMILGTSINGIISGSNGALVSTTDQEITHTKLTGMVVTQGTVNASNTIVQAIGHLAANQMNVVKCLAKQIEMGGVELTLEEKSIVGELNGSMTVPAQHTESVIKISLGMLFQISNTFALKVRINGQLAGFLNFTENSSSLLVTGDITMNVYEGNLIYTFIRILPSNGAILNNLVAPHAWDSSIDNVIEVSGQFASASDRMEVYTFDMILM